MGSVRLIPEDCVHNNSNTVKVGSICLKKSQPYSLVYCYWQQEQGY